MIDLNTNVLFQSIWLQIYIFKLFGQDDIYLITNIKIYVVIMCRHHHGPYRIINNYHYFQNWNRYKNKKVASSLDHYSIIIPVKCSLLIKHLKELHLRMREFELLTYLYVIHNYRFGVEFMLPERRKDETQNLKLF